jgi:dolichyl-phosphate-mannose--protein O-mannosyl transferase
LGNPFVWWGAFAAIGYLLYHLIRNRGRAARTEGLILLGVAAGYLPWMLYMQRTIFQFYAIVTLPFQILALVYVLRSLWYRRPLQSTIDDLKAIAGVEPAQEFPGPPPVTRWRKAIVIYLFSCVALSLFFITIWWGVNTPYWYWLIHMWLPTWI